MILDKAAIMTAAKKAPRMEEVEVPELGGSVFVRVMTGTERDAWEEQQTKSRFSSFRARITVATVCDEKGQLLFTSADINDVGTIDSTSLDRIFDVAKRLNGLTPDDMKELAKNSGKTDGDSRPSVFLDGSARPEKS